MLNSIILPGKRRLSADLVFRPAGKVAEMASIGYAFLEAGFLAVDRRVEQ